MTKEEKKIKMIKDAVAKMEKEVKDNPNMKPEHRRLKLSVAACLEEFLPD